MNLIFQLSTSCLRGFNKLLKLERVRPSFSTFHWSFHLLQATKAIP